MVPSASLLYEYLFNITPSGDANNKSYNGGGIYSDSSYAIMSMCTTSENYAHSHESLFNVTSPGDDSKKSYNGGGFFSCFSSYATMSMCNASENTAQYGAGIYITLVSFICIEESKLDFNAASQRGGGFFLASSSVVDIISSVIERNQAFGGGGGIAIKSPTSSLKLNRTLISANVAIRSYGGAIYVIGGEVTLIDCLMEKNQASGPYFILSAGSCTAIGSCIYSTNFPSEYSRNENCNFNLSARGVIDALSFDTEVGFDFLSLYRNGTLLEEYSGTVGPTALTVSASDILKWESDHSVVSNGFEVCFDVVRSYGGGMYIADPGAVTLIRTTLTENVATDLGGGMYVSGGQVSLYDGSSIKSNTAGEGSALYLAGGSFSAVDLSLSGSISGVSAQSAKCTSPCFSGSYGICNTTLSSAPSCFFDCECNICPAGKYNPSAGSTGISSCIDCGSGYASQAGAFECTACSKGRFAANGSSDNSGGIVTQTLNAATSCNKCPAGYFSNSVTSIVCQKCPDSKYSFPGNTSCDLCSSGYFLHDSSCRSCLSGASCVKNGLFLYDIYLTKSHWRISDKSDLIYNCTMKLACQGGSNFSDSGDGYCSSGYEGPLCAVCSADYYYSPDDLACVACDSGGERSAAKIIFSTTILIVLIALLTATCGGILYCLDKRSRASENDDLEEKRGKLNRALNRLWGPLYTQARMSEQCEILEPVYTRIMDVFLVLKHTQIKAKMLAAFGQIAINTGFNCKVDFPKTFTAVLNALKLLNLDIVPSLGLQCKFEFDYCSKMVVVCVSPLIVFILLLVLYLKQTSSGMIENKQVSTENLQSIYYASEELHAFFGKKIENYCQLFKIFDPNSSGELNKAEVMKLFSTIDSDATEKVIEDSVSAFFAAIEQDDKSKIKFGEFLAGMRVALEQRQSCKFAGLAAKIDAKATQSRGQLAFYFILFLTFLVLVSTSSTIFQYFDCDYFQLPEGGKLAYLFVDYSIDCNSKKYNKSLLFAVSMVLIYPIGIPCMYATLLWKNRKILSDAEEMEQETLNGYQRVGHLHFLVDSYKPNFFMFEVFECLRRLLLGSVIGMASADSPASALMGILFSLVYTFVFTHFRPFKIEDDSDIAIILAYSINLLFLAALLLKVNASSANSLDNHLFDALLCIVIFSGPIVIVLKLLHQNIRLLKAGKVMNKCINRCLASHDENVIVNDMIELQALSHESAPHDSTLSFTNPMIQNGSFLPDSNASTDQIIQQLIYERDSLKDQLYQCEKVICEWETSSFSKVTGRLELKKENEIIAIPNDRELPLW